MEVKAPRLSPTCQVESRAGLNLSRAECGTRARVLCAQYRCRIESREFLCKQLRRSRAGSWRLQAWRAPMRRHLRPSGRAATAAPPAVPRSNHSGSPRQCYPPETSSRGAVVLCCRGAVVLCRKHHANVGYKRGKRRRSTEREGQDASLQFRRQVDALCTLCCRQHQHPRAQPPPLLGR